MSDTRNYGKLKVGIDWEDKGYVSFGQETQEGGDDLNQFTEARFFASSYGTRTTFPYYDSSIIRTRNIPAPLGLYGLEKVVTVFNTDNQVLYIGWNEAFQHVIPVGGTVDYTAFIWLSSDVPFTNDADHHLSLSFYTYNSSEAIVSSNSIDLDLTGNNVIQAFGMEHTTASDSETMALIISKGDEPGTDIGSITVTVHGIFLRNFSDLTVPNWNGGDELPEEPIVNEITSYVLQASGSIGKTNWETLLFDEGTLQLDVQNTDRRFSPEYAEGAYFGYLKPYRRVWVAISDSLGEYHLLWAGWTHQYFLNTGNTNDRRAKITARQGKYRVESQDASALQILGGLSPYPDNYSSELIRVLFSGGYEIPYQSVDDTVTPLIILKEAGERGVVVPLFGAQYAGGAEKNFLESLEDISELNGNYLFLDRQGLVVFKTYESVREETPQELPYELTMEMPYTYAPNDLFKEVVVTYDEYATNDETEMQGQDFIIPFDVTDFQFNIYPQYNNKPLIGDVVLDGSAYLPVDYNATPAFGSASAAFTLLTDGLYTYYTGLATNSTDLDHRLSMVSRDSGNVFYVREAAKKYTVAGISDRALETLSYDNPLITNDTMAENFAEMQINRRSSVVSWFSSALIVNKNAEAVDWIVNHSLGDVIYSDEEQMGEIPKHEIIIGESFNYTPGYLQMNYSLAPTGAEVDIAAFDYEVNGQVVDFENLSVTSLPPDYLWDFDD